MPTSAANRDYKPGFAAALMLKDLRLASAAAAEAGVASSLGAAASDLYAALVAADAQGLDYSAIINLIRERSGASS